MIQMGSSMKPTIFNDKVASALKKWHHSAKKHVKELGKRSSECTPLSSPTHGMSPVHLLHRHALRSSDSPQISPRASSSSYNNNNENNDQWDIELGSPETSHDNVILEPTSTAETPPVSTHQNEISISLSDFSFKKPKGRDYSYV